MYSGAVCLAFPAVNGARSSHGRSRRLSERSLDREFLARRGLNDQAEVWREMQGVQRLPESTTFRSVR